MSWRIQLCFCVRVYIRVSFTTFTKQCIVDLFPHFGYTSCISVKKQFSLIPLFYLILTLPGKPFESSAVVSKVRQDSSAEKAGLCVGDRIIAIDNEPIRSMNFLDLSNLLRRSP